MRDLPLKQVVQICRSFTDWMTKCFPDGVPARKRKTYWRWCKSNSVVDVFISDLDGMSVLHFESLGLSNPMDPAQYTEAFEKASQDCVVPMLQLHCPSAAKDIDDRTIAVALLLSKLVFV